jgi:hypothetical protein
VLTRVAFIIGGLGGVAWLMLPFYPPQCAPVTAASEIFCARLWTPILAALLVGVIAMASTIVRQAAPGGRIGLRPLSLGFAQKVVWNGAEYWPLSHMPHQGPDGWFRGFPWMSTLLGWLLALGSSFVVGIRWARASYDPRRRLGLMLVTPLPLTFGLAALGPSWVPIPIGLLRLAIGGVGLAAARNEETERET